MAVQSDTSRIQYAGNNSTTTSYAVPFVFQENSHLKAIARTSAGVESVVTLTNHTGAGNVNGGTVRTAVAVPATSTLTIYREVPATQTTTYAEGGDFPAASHERALDKLTQIAQQLKRNVESSVRMTDAVPLAPLVVPTGSTPHVLTTVNGGAPTWETVPSVSTALNIPSLTDASTVNGSDELIVQQSGVPKRATANELFNGSSTVTATGSTEARNLKDRFADVVNVKDFGAVGDGVADDTAAIQAALNYASTTATTLIANKVNTVKGKVFLPSGKYKTSATLLVGEGVTMEGASQSSSIIYPTHSGVAVQMGGSSREYSQVKLRHLGIAGNRTGTLSFSNWTTTTTIGVYAENCIRECSIEHCFISQCETSIKLENSYAFEINTNYLAYAKNYHIESDNMVAGSICGNRIDWSEGHGIYINGTNSGDETLSLDIESNAIQICWRNGLWLYDVSSATVQNNFFEGNYREAVDASTRVYADINIESGANNRGYSFNVIGNFFTHGSSPDVDAYTAIRCNRAVALVVTGNTCRDSYYWRFIDAGNANVQRITALGNSYEGTFESKVFYNAAMRGILEEELGSGVILVSNLIANSARLGATVSGSNQTSSDSRTIYLISTSGGNRSVTLRDADCIAGRVYFVKKTDGGANTLTVQREPGGEPGGEKTIDGATSVSSASAYASFRITSDGINWFTF